MAAGRPFFPGSNTEEQLHLIFRALGSPRADQYPALTSSKEYLSYQFPQYRAEPLVNHAPRLDNDGLDLLAQLLQVETRQRSLAISNCELFQLFGCSSKGSGESRRAPLLDRTSSRHSPRLCTS